MKLLSNTNALLLLPLAMSIVPSAHAGKGMMSAKKASMKKTHKKMKMSKKKGVKSNAMDIPARSPPVPVPPTIPPVPPPTGEPPLSPISSITPFKPPSDTAGTFISYGNFTDRYGVVQELTYDNLMYEWGNLLSLMEDGNADGDTGDRDTIKLLYESDEIVEYGKPLFFTNVHQGWFGRPTALLELDNATTVPEIRAALLQCSLCRYEAAVFGSSYVDWLARSLLSDNTEALVEINKMEINLLAHNPFFFLETTATLLIDGETVPNPASFYVNSDLRSIPADRSVAVDFTIDNSSGLGFLIPSLAPGWHTIEATSTALNWFRPGTFLEFVLPVGFPVTQSDTYVFCVADASFTATDCAATRPTSRRLTRSHHRRRFLLDECPFSNRIGLEMKV